jgi:hypothetical protein
LDWSWAVTKIHKNLGAIGIIPTTQWEIGLN